MHEPCGRRNMDYVHIRATVKVSRGRIFATQRLVFWIVHEHYSWDSPIMHCRFMSAKSPSHLSSGSTQVTNESISSLRQSTSLYLYQLPQIHLGAQRYTSVHQDNGLLGPSIKRSQGVVSQPTRLQSEPDICTTRVGVRVKARGTRQLGRFDI